MFLCLLLLRLLNRIKPPQKKLPRNINWLNQMLNPRLVATHLEGEIVIQNATITMCMHAASEGFLRSMAIYVPKVRPPYIGGMVSPALIENPYNGYILVYKPPNHWAYGEQSNKQFENSPRLRDLVGSAGAVSFTPGRGEMIRWQTVNWGGMVWMTTRLVQPPTWRIIPGLVSG